MNNIKIKSIRHSEQSEESLTRAYITFLIILFSVTTLLAQNTAPEVTNVRFEQRTDGTHIVDIYYDVTDSEQSEVKVSVEVSNDAGTTWDFTATSLTGDIGENISIGTNKHIVWDFATDHTNYYSNQIKIKVFADDLVRGIPCHGTPTVTYRGQVYSTVQIGDQCWFKENLNIGTMLGSYFSNFLQTDNDTIEKYCHYDDENNCTKYGGLYQLDEAMQYAIVEGGRGICPDGWHIPTKGEFEILKNYVNDEAAKLVDISASSYATAFTPTNESGFSALFAGYIYDIVTNNMEAIFWSSTAYTNDMTYMLTMEYNNSDVNMFIYPSHRPFSVRCLRD